MTLTFGAACQACHTRGVNRNGDSCYRCAGTGIEPGEHAPVRRSDPETSKQAAASVTDLTGKQRRVLETLKAFGPMTDERLVTLVRDAMKDSTARTRRAELVGKGYVVAVGSEVLPSGRSATVWAAAK